MLPNKFILRFFTVKNYTLYLFMFVVLFKEILFSLIVPMWHGPDEQAHFAQVSFFAENNHMASGAGNDLSNEILISEKLLGTDRDERGNNKFTFHPEYRIDYTNNLIGVHEKEIQNIPLNERGAYEKQEAARYPPLYYLIGAQPYKIFYSSDLIMRLYAVRLISILCGVGIALIAFLISKELFPKNKLYQYTSTIFVAFHPMLSFVSSTVNSDNLFNLLFALFIYLNLLVVRQGVRIKNLVLLLISFSFMAVTKPQFILGLPLLGVSVFLSLFYFYNLRTITVMKVTLGMIISVIVGIWIIRITNLIDLFQSTLYPQSFSTGYISGTKSLSFIQFFQQTVTHTYAEVVPWYWGIFNWLGVALPRDVNRVINRLMIISGLGLGVKFFVMIKNRSKESILIIFLVVTSLTYFLGITIFNYFFTLSHGFPFGIQGRYYFPTITAHMMLLFIGLISLVPNKWIALKQTWSKILGLGMILLNLIALWTIASGYYDLSDLRAFTTQVSQYKPYFYKGDFAIFWITTFTILLLAFIYSYLRIKASRDE